MTYPGPAPGRTGRPPGLSVVVPTYNRAARLTRLLEALEAQSIGPEGFEVIVVDDCSTDDTAAVLERFSASDRLDLRALRTPRNTGGAAAPRNLGWRAARASVVGFVDDDCVPAAGWLEPVLPVFAGQPGLGVLQGRVEPPPGVDEDTLDRWCVLRRVSGPTPWFECANIFYSRAALEAAGGFDETFGPWAEDTDLGWRVVDSGYERGFCADAVVVHDVEDRGWRRAARIGWLDQQLVQVAVRHPELRRQAFWRPWAVKRQDVEFVVAVTGVALSRVWRPALLAALPYMWLHRPPFRRDGVNRRTVEIGFETVAVDLARLAGRLRGSIRAGTLVI